MSPIVSGNIANPKAAKTIPTVITKFSLLVKARLLDVINSSIPSFAGKMQSGAAANIANINPMVPMLIKMLSL